MSRYILSPHAQGTPEWLADRAGRATGSCAAKILAKIKSGEAATRRDYRFQLAVERLTGRPAEPGYVSAEMEWGTLQEPSARLAYEAATGNAVREAGFAYLPSIMTGCSVDGFIDDGGRVGIQEIKCPKTATHISYLLAERLPPDYEPQVLHNMWVTGAEFADFVSFDPRLPEKLQLFIVRIERNEDAIKAHEKEVMLFLFEVAELENQLRKRAEQ